MTIETAIYAGGAFANGGTPAVNDIINAGYSTLIMWSVHVHSNGDLILNDPTIVSDGKYVDETMDLPTRLAAVRNKGVKIGFSVGSGGWQGSDGYHPNMDPWNVLNGMGNANSEPGQDIAGSTNIIYKNFEALLSKMQTVAGGGIDFIDFDFEDFVVDEQMTPMSSQQIQTLIVNFSMMLSDIGYTNVSFCPYESSDVWQTALTTLVGKKDADFVRALNVQFYSGGRFNGMKTWSDVITDAGSNALLVPGLSTNNTENGWWSSSTAVKKPGVAMYGGGDWSNYIRRGNYQSVDDAKSAAGTESSFFFYCSGAFSLSNGMSFKAGDAAFFMAEPQWGDAPFADGYSLSGPTVAAQNPPGVGGCPDDFKSQFSTWLSDATNGKYKAPDGGFVWMYDSVIGTELTLSCRSSDNDPIADATAYRNAIKNGLS